MKRQNLILVFLTVFMLLPCLVSAENFIVVYINPNDLSWASGQGNSLDAASKIASESCGSGCRRAGYSRNACVALAIRNDDGTCWGSSWGNSIGEAEGKAMDICHKHGCRCVVVFSECYK